MAAAGWPVCRLLPILTSSQETAYSPRRRGGKEAKSRPEKDRLTPRSGAMWLIRCVPTACAVGYDLPPFGLGRGPIQIDSGPPGTEFSSRNVETAVKGAALVWSSRQGFLPPLSRFPEIEIPNWFRPPTPCVFAALPDSPPAGRSRSLPDRWRNRWPGRHIRQTYWFPESPPPPPACRWRDTRVT